MLPRTSRVQPSGVPRERPDVQDISPYDGSVRAAAEYKDQAPRWLKDLANVSTRAYALGTVGLRPAPDYLVIGSKRGGTTSLHNYLLGHPGVLGLFPQSRGKKSTDFFFPSEQRRLGWYRSHFHTGAYRTLRKRQLGHRPLSGEASPYYVWDPRVAPRIREAVPHVKAILLLRDPVERAWSHYWERRVNGVEPLSFPDAIASEDARTGGELERMMVDPDYYSAPYDFYTYRQRGHYLPQILNWLAHFPPEQLLIMVSEEMYEDPQRAFDRVCRFLELPEVRLSGATRKYNSVQQGTMDAQVRRRLTAEFTEPNHALETFLGRKLPWS